MKGKMEKINVSYIDPIGEYTSYQDLIEGQRKRIEILESAMQECLQLLQSIQNSRIGHSPHLVYCDRSFRKDKIDSLSEKLYKLLET